MTIGLFYGSSTCYTEIAAEKIRDCLAEMHVQVVLHNVASEPLTTMLAYDKLILGIPTWDYGELQEDWERVWPELSALDLSGKQVAIYGCGDQIGYPEWFQDAVGYLHNQVRLQGAKVLGYWPTAAYEFIASMALTDDGSHFVGLALDEENEFDLSEERIQTWCRQLLSEFE